MEETGMIIFAIFLIIGVIIFAAWAAITGEKKQKAKIEEEERLLQEKLRIEEEERQKEEERRKEEEWRNSTLCVICENHSYGDVICSDCWDRRLVIKKELPYKRVCTYELINEYKNELMYKIVFPETQFERETNSVKLLAVAEILDKKYCQSNALDKTQIFLEDVVSNDIESTEELLEKYQLKPETVSEEKKNYEQEEKPNDYRANYPKPYRCEDGDYVRSKAEREIDNFLFQNRIWHVYESEYVNPQDNQKYYPDFFLPDYNLYIEYFGLTDDKYIEKMKEKIRMYEADSTIKFTIINHYDDANIVEKLNEICRSHNIPLK